MRSVSANHTPARPAPRADRGRVGRGRVGRGRVGRGRALLGAGALCGGLVLSGCIQIQSQSSSQDGVMGAVRVTLSVCGNGSGAGPCPGAESPRQVQVLLGFRIPSGSAGPTSFPANSPGPTRLTFTQSPSYTSELQRLAPAPAGQQWQGYISNAFLYTGAENSFSVQPDFSLPLQGNAPFAGPFSYRPVVGYRDVTSAPPNPSDPVDCQATGTTTCIDDPPQPTRDTNLQQSTRDAVIVPGAPVTAPAGTLATVPFQLRVAGTGFPGFSLNAGADIPGAPSVPAPLGLTPADNSTTSVPVGVAIPPATPPGTYQVILAADLPDTEFRAAAAQLIVTPAANPGAPPPGLPPRCRVPELRGQTVATATIILRNAGCRLGEVTRRRSHLRRGKVIGQKPYAGTNQSAGKSVTLHVSSGHRRHRRAR